MNIGEPIKIVVPAPLWVPAPRPGREREPVAPSPIPEREPVAPSPIPEREREKVQP